MVLTFRWRVADSAMSELDVPGLASWYESRAGSFERVILSCPTCLRDEASATSSTQRASGGFYIVARAVSMRESTNESRSIKVPIWPMSAYYRAAPSLPALRYAL